MHIRQVLVKAELEKFQQYKEIYTALKKGKVQAGVLTRETKHFKHSVSAGMELNGLLERICHFSAFSFASRVGPRGSPCSPGPTTANFANGNFFNFAKQKLSYI